MKLLYNHQRINPNSLFCIEKRVVYKENLDRREKIEDQKPQVQKEKVDIKAEGKKKEGQVKRAIDTLKNIVSDDVSSQFEEQIEDLKDTVSDKVASGDMSAKIHETASKAKGGSKFGG